MYFSDQERVTSLGTGSGDRREIRSDGITIYDKCQLLTHSAEELVHMHNARPHIHNKVLCVWAQTADGHMGVMRRGDAVCHLS